MDQSIKNKVGRPRLSDEQKKINKIESNKKYYNKCKELINIARSKI